MNRPKSQLFLVYTIIVALLFLALLSLIVPLSNGSDRIMIIVVLIGAFAIVEIILYQIYLNYIAPVKLINVIMKELVKGNYKVRAFESYHHDSGKLAKSVNQLARNLQDLNRQEKMQSRQLNTVIDNMESGIMLIDEQGYVHLVNRKFTDQFGKQSEDYYGRIYYEVLDQAKIYQTVQEAFLYEQSVKASITLNNGDQKTYIEVVGAPFFNEEKDLRGIVLVFHDITDLKRVEQMRKDFVANVSHELKTPITSIKGFAETMLDDDVDQNIQTRFLKIIYNESDRLQSLIHDLLELSKLEKDELKLKFTNIKVVDLIEECIDIVSGQADKKSITITFEQNNRPQITGDEARIKQVILNLLFNAINYTGGFGIINIALQYEKQWLRVEVRDNGIGIPGEAQARIFERFYRVDKARSRNTGGTGLGLAIVKHIVEAHHGFIEVESELNKGTAFYVYLPVN
ncbi:two-component system, OmpR family, phosphate regulon sensor histidine kinase PhoR [Amphibacillus marinus]|uniref:histidine kinase n=1 Tax=Amphibacillus marinus TaxID=872970 RepID=A0A1H8T452_9BACI|nr:ATP-binding protein [Amphibacillus marinus]SEO85585.1 two-component system, OmpR family, phosphate regulon sensor histidine kinase PhoR [Amphibacillus marinus]